MEKVSITISGSPIDLINSFCHRYTEEVFRVNYIYTLGYDICTKNIIIEQKEMEQNIIHINDKSMFRAIRRDLFLSSEGLIVVLDNGDRSYLLNSKKIVQEFKEVNSGLIFLIVIVRDINESVNTETLNYLEQNSISYQTILIDNFEGFKKTIIEFTNSILKNKEKMIDKPD